MLLDLLPLFDEAPLPVGAITAHGRGPRLARHGQAQIAYRPRRLAWGIGQSTARIPLRPVSIATAGTVHATATARRTAVSHVEDVGEIEELLLLAWELLHE